MTSTNYEEFKKLFYRIPKERLDYTHFIPLRVGSKVPIGNWKGKVHLNLYECKDVLKTGGNIAIAGIPNGLMFLDIDTDNNGNVKMPLFLMDSIPNTFRVKTRSGGFHFYFLNDGEWDNQKFIYQGNEIGELRTNWQYVVSAGSWVAPETYRIVNDVPILRFDGEITQYFRKGNVKDLTPNRPAPTEGKIGKVITEEHRKVLEEFKRFVEDSKSLMEGDILKEDKAIADRRKEILAKLKRT